MSCLKSMIPDDWRGILGEECEKEYFAKLEEFVSEEIEKYPGQIFPETENIFAALKYTPYDKVKVLLLGQDPYHDHGQAHGLCFSVPDGVKLPPSLRNMYKELASDLNIKAPQSGSLVHWAHQGMLLLNTSLTVRAHEPASHSKKGWEQFTDAVISAVNRRAEPVIFVLWGGHAAAKEKLIDAEKHVVMKSAHPSPLSASRGFLGSRPYSKINEALAKLGHTPIKWIDNIPVQAEFSF